MNDNSCVATKIGSGIKAWTVLAGVSVAALSAHAGVSVSRDEMAQESQWVREHLLKADSPPPFSFIYGGKPLSEILPTWKRSESDSALDANRSRHEIKWTNGVVQVRCVVVEYRDFPVAEWTVYLKDISSKPTPIIEKIEALDLNLSRGGGPEFVLNGNKGDYSAKDSYEPYRIVLGPASLHEFAPLHIPDADYELTGIGTSESGKSCDGPKGWPYYNLQVPGGGIIMAIGWPGQWASSFARDQSSNLRIKAGQQLTHLYLKPGEEIRTPLITMLFWAGDDVVRSQNLWRRWYIADNEPRVGGAPQPLTAQGPSDDIPKLEEMLAAGIKVDNCWRDAEGKGGTWWVSETGPYHAVKAGEQTTSALRAATAWWNTGTWDVDPKKYPEGFKPFSDWVHAHGLTFMLWFEPERVGNPNSWLGRNHPEWLLPTNQLTYGIHPSYDPILDEGNPAALDWLTNHVDGVIKAQGVDVYREDMNGAGPCPAWRRTDTFDRQGITENFYVQGHLAFWDELLRRNPRLRIDSCASGGRRNDLESMRRGVSIGNRSDFMGGDIPAIVEGNQGHTYGLSSWLPYQGAYAPLNDIYSYRSFYATSFGVGGDINLQKKAYGDWRRMAPFLLGDYYPLTAYSLDRDQWIAWQFDRPDLNSGEVQAFRRPECPYESARFKLHGLEAKANYQVENLDGGQETHSGSELMEKGLAISTTTAPAAEVLIYRRLN